MKKNKFFKALGVGAVATLGLFTMAGCSLSDSEKADVMEGLENANTYMEETIDLLKEQNRKLNEQNQELNEQNQILREQNESLENYLDEFKQENAKITTEDAFNKLMIAKAKLETNNNGIRNNLRVICVATDGVFTQNQIVELYKTENNGYVSNVVLDDDFSGFSSNLCYEDGDNVYEYIVDKDLEGNFVKYTKEVRADFLSSESGSGLIYLMTPMFLDKLSAENIYSVEILENGNYKISAIVESEFEEEGEDYYYNKQTYLLEYEITSDYKLISMNINQFVKTTEEVENGLVEEHSFTTSGSVRIDYNTITEEYINELLQEAISKDPKAPVEE